MPPILLQSRGAILRNRTVQTDVAVIDEDVEDSRGGGGAVFSSAGALGKGVLEM
jgi:hypothetical protein